MARSQDSLVLDRHLPGHGYGIAASDRADECAGRDGSFRQGKAKGSKALAHDAGASWRGLIASSPCTVFHEIAQDCLVEFGQAVFGMPLHPQTEAARVAFEGLDDTVPRPRCDPKSPAPGERVPMQTVHLDLAPAKNTGKTAGGLDGNAMGQAIGNRAWHVFNRFSDRFWQTRDECTPQPFADQLHAMANAEQWLSRFQRLPDKLEFEFAPFRRGFQPRCGAGDHDAVG
jgi:hypothetical protein